VERSIRNTAVSFPSSAWGRTSSKLRFEFARIVAAVRSLLVGFALMASAIVPGRAADSKPAEKTEPIKTLTLRLLDADHKPVAGAHVGTFADYSQKRRRPEISDESGFLYVAHCVSDKDGVAKFPSKRSDLADYRGHVQIVARHAGRGLIAFADLDGAHYRPVVELTLVQERRISGKLVCPELAKLGRKIDWTNVYLSMGRARMMACDSETGDFHFFVPPGNYELNAYGKYAASKNATVTVPGGKREIELTLTLPAKKFALLMGHPAPELRDIAAWKNGPPVKLADLKGKCVLLEFWGYWCGPCVYRMPETFKLYDQYGKQGLVVIGVHVDYSNAVDSVEKLDAKLVDTRKKLWHGRDLPFPVAITRPIKGAEVARDYGINSYPSMLLIDRRGNLVDIVSPGPAGLAMLLKALDEKLAGQASATTPAGA
jgi:thiol-disulfide isomerase/thioredoxin